MSEVMLTKPTEEPKNGVFVGTKGKGKSLFGIFQKNKKDVMQVFNENIEFAKNINSHDLHTMVIGRPGSGKVRSFIRPIENAESEE